MIIDEVLAVGDLAFQRKCIGKMDDVAKRGRTVLFVSHSMPTVTRLCSRAILLNEGRVVFDGVTSEAVKKYLQYVSRGEPVRVWPVQSESPGNDIVRLRSVRVISESRATESVLDIRRPVGIELQYDVLRDDEILWPQVRFFNTENICLFCSIDQDQNPKRFGSYTSTVWVPGNTFAEGTIFTNVYITKRESSQVHETEVVAFNIVDPVEGDSARGLYTGDFPGILRPKLSWHTSFDLPAA
jgi:lipopolysaccharide transport system ATP-binding protein